MTLPLIKLPRPMRRTIVKILNCKQASQLVSREYEQPLSRSERFWLHLHLYICTGCRNFKNNMQIMRAAMKQYLDKGADRNNGDK